MRPIRLTLALTVVTLSAATAPAAAITGPAGTLIGPVGEGALRLDGTGLTLFLPDAPPRAIALAPPPAGNDPILAVGGTPARLFAFTASTLYEGPATGPLAPVQTFEPRLVAATANGPRGLATLASGAGVRVDAAGTGPVTLTPVPATAGLFAPAAGGLPPGGATRLVGDMALGLDRVTANGRVTLRARVSSLATNTPVTTIDAPPVASGIADIRDAHPVGTGAIVAEVTGPGGPRLSVIPPGGGSARTIVGDEIAATGPISVLVQERASLLLREVAAADGRVLGQLEMPARVTMSSAGRVVPTGALLIGVPDEGCGRTRPTPLFSTGRVRAALIALTNAVPASCPLLLETRTPVRVGRSGRIAVALRCRQPRKSRCRSTVAIKAGRKVIARTTLAQRAGTLGRVRATVPPNLRKEKLSAQVATSGAQRVTYTLSRG